MATLCANAPHCRTSTEIDENSAPITILRKGTGPLYFCSGDCLFEWQMQEFIYQGKLGQSVLDRYRRDGVWPPE